MKYVQEAGRKKSEERGISENISARRHERTKVETAQVAEYIYIYIYI